jgi:3-oxoacyl-[acyl-carrier protein] reductase
MSVPVPGLDGRVAIVTGASRGIGRAIALGLARAGANLALTVSEDDADGARRPAG